MYRSPGTASSPDLATLLRKAKERGGKDGRKATATPSREREAVPSSPPSVQVTPAQGADQRHPITWERTKIPRSLSSFKEGGKPAKSSVRAKTSAFLGKMLGSSSARERSRTLTSSPSTTSIATYSTSPLFEAFQPPPVPPLPKNARMPIASDSSDVFSAASSSSDVKAAAVTRNGARFSEATDESDSLVLLDPISASSLDLRVPSTPPKHPHLLSQDENVTASTRTVRPIPKESRTLPEPPTVTLQPVSMVEESILGAVLSSPTLTPTPLAGPVVPPRTSSLNTPLRPRAGSSADNIPRVTTLRYGPRSPPSRSGALAATHLHSSSRDSNRLRVQHRSTASASEPSLIPDRDDGRVPHPLSTSSQQDLTTNDLITTRFALRQSPSKLEDSADIEARGKDLASKCWAEDEEFLPKDKIAEWLGGQSLINKTALRYYMDFFDFSNLRIDMAFRRLCAKLFLKAETQQVDRILEEFGRRFWDCNPTSIFGSASVVHAAAYSLLLLNTDLHVAELTSRMSRGQFIRNTIAAIQMQVQPGGLGSSTDLSYDDWSSLRGGSDGGDAAGSTVRRMKRSDSITSWNSITRDALSPLPGPIIGGNSSGQLTTASDSVGQSSANESAVSVAVSSGNNSKAQDSSATTTPAISTPAPPASTMVYDRNWEAEMETMLKDIYNAVKAQQILQPIGSALMARSSTSSLSPHGAVLRNRSVRTQQDRLTTLKRGSIRGLQSILNAQSGISPYSSNSSIDGRASPAPSFATSHEGLHGSSVSFLAPTLGFASNLSHTIIREAQEDDNHSVNSVNSSTDISITDEELALLGPPWAKEGMLCRKQYWESAGKRARSKAWMDVFVVIQKGELSMFTFGEHGMGGSSVVGGGNWLENATPVGNVLLAHSLAHALPPPGYNRQRPHCMVLTLASGAVYFFQAGTEELVNEWVSTCNYWAARQSREPLAGGVSNMEYGWNRVIDPVTRTRSISEDNYSVRDTDSADVVSIRSGRSRFKDIAATVRADKSPWTDRTFINDWKPPLPPTVASRHDEETQLEALQKHVASLKDDLQQHNELRTPMMHLYQPRSSNATRALSNWEKKSQYLLTESVKYDSYIDSLRTAMNLRLKRRGEKALERALIGSTSDDGTVEATGPKSKWKGQPDEETIEEGEEPPPSAGLRKSPVGTHRREVAETENMGDDD
ncbi:PH and SEC7 domain-containing protein C11E3.11c [Grifola frondosa]|uniref:PH and SEC7 domain-containing protein C11E3.11c n=1 Tax=Grifola frondosa TaxID=5627 RepID=A0A1C7LU09_GRIFR|nr:PH and SEC7 domain-containing protein C11E3.11c [Grifola frondosa]